MSGVVRFDAQGARQQGSAPLFSTTRQRGDRGIENASMAKWDAAPVQHPVGFGAEVESGGRDRSMGLASRCGADCVQDNCEVDRRGQAHSSDTPLSHYPPFPRNLWRRERSFQV